ncbi:MAG: DJ-1/PfpI family protein, partial [Myxococcales bacterium]|nr:DJ-1/PfpI family protein [Myxococcales bacterium]
GRNPGDGEPQDVGALLDRFAGRREHIPFAVLLCAVLTRLRLGDRVLHAQRGLFGYLASDRSQPRHVRVGELAASLREGSGDRLADDRLSRAPALQADLENAGAEWVDQEVVVDDNLVTSRKPEDIPAFSKALIEKIAARPALRVSRTKQRTRRPRAGL